MKLTVCVLLCLGSALASSHLDRWTWANDPSVLSQAIEEQQEFRSGRELKYIYNGQVMTGIPGTSKQHSGSRIQAKVTFVCKHQQTCVLNVDQIRVGKLNRNVKTPRNVLPIGAFDEIPLDFKQREKLHLPIKFSYTKGMINDIVFDGREQPWSANIKRGILNLIQVDLQKKKTSTSMDVIDIVEDEFLNTYRPTERDASFYRTMEETIEGQCETMYTVTRPQIFKSTHEQVLNVTKTVNFEKCIKRPQIKYNFHFTDPCPTCEDKYTEDQKFLKSSSISSYQVIKTPRFNVINNAYTESEYVFVPFNEEANAVVTYVSQNLKLIKTSVALRRVKVPMNPVKSDSDMIYTLDYEIAKENFQMEGDSTGLRDSLLHKNQNKIQIAKVLLRKLVNDIREQVQEPATKHFNQLVNLFRLLSKIEIDQIHNVVLERVSFTELTQQEQKRVKDLLHDIIGAAGTKACVQHLVEKIKRHEISIVKAVSAIKNLNTMRTPSKEIIKELISLAESPISERHYMLKQATWLTIGSLMQVLCSNNVDQWARETKETVHKMCPKTLKQEYTKILIKKLHSSHKWDDQLIYIKALGNAGIDLSIFELEKIIYNKNFNYKTMIRIESILALRQLKSVMPKKIQKVLMPIVSNKMEPQTLRISAAYMILQTLPSRPILEQLAKLVQNERSIQVSSFVYSYMNSMANSTNPCEKKLATDLKVSLRQTHRIYSRILGNSKFYRLPVHSQHQKVGLDLDLTSTFAEDRFVPHQLAATLHSNFLGFWNKYLVSFRLATEGLDKVLRRTYSRLGYEREFDQLVGGESFFGNDYENMFSPLNIFGEKSRGVSADPKAVLSLKLKNQDVAFLPIKRHAIESWLLGQPTGNMVALEQKLRQGVSINYNKATMMEEIMYKIPTTIGMPVMVNIKVPVVMNVHGAIKMTAGVGGDLSAFQLKAVLKPSLVATVSVDVECWSPIVATGVNIASKIKAFQPIDAKVLVDLKSENKIVKLLFKPPTQRKDLITLESRPSTFTLVQPKQTLSFENKQKRLILSEEGIRVRTINKCNTCNVLGIRFCIKGRYHKTPEHSLTGTPFTPLSGPNRIVISTEPKINTPHTIAINLFGKFLKPISTSSIQSTLSSAQKNFLNYVSGEEYRTEDNYVRDDLMVEAARFNQVPTNNPLLKHRQVKRPLLNSLRVQVDAPQRHMTFDLVHIFNLEGDYQKVQLKVDRSPVPEHPQPWKLCINAESVFPTLKMIRNLRDQEVLGKLSAHWGHSCNSPNFVRIVKRLEKREHSRLYELENPEWKLYKDSNLIHDELLEKSPIKYIFDIKYNNVPLKTKNYANEVLRLIKKRYFDQTNVAEVAVQNRHQHVKVIVAVDPITLKKCDILVKTPKSNVLIRDVPMPTYASPITHKTDFLKNELKSLSRESLLSPSTAQCYASEYKLKTFHDKELPLPLSHSYKVLSKDCQTNKYTVLVRQLTEYPTLKEVKIITPTNKITLKPSVSRKDVTKVFVNGRDYTMENDIVKTLAGVPILRIIRQSSHVKVEIIDAQTIVYFDRKSVNVEIPPQNRHKQCGICSNSNFQGLRLEFPAYLQESSILNEIEQEYFQGEQGQASIFETTSRFNPSRQIQSLFRDYSTSEDVLSHYFNWSPLDREDRYTTEEKILEEQLFDNDLERGLFESSYLTPREDILEREVLNQEYNNKAWSRPQERSWEIRQLIPESGRRQNPAYEALVDWEKVNSRFDQSSYSPLSYSSLELEFPQEFLSREFSPIRSESRLNQLVDEEYLRNPYLRQNFLVNEEECRYLPFWERKLKGCQAEQELFAEFETPYSGYESQLFAADRLFQDESALLEEYPSTESRFLKEQIVENQLEREIAYEQDFSGYQNQDLLNEVYERRSFEENEFDRFTGRKQKIIETEHSVCFSMIPVECADKTNPKESQRRSVPYHCMSRQNPETHRIQNEILAGRPFVPSVQSRTPTMSRVEVVPTRCQPVY